MEVHNGAVESGAMTSSTDHAALEEGLVQQLDFDKVAKIGRAGHQVVPVVLQDADSGDVLFIGYANEEAYRLTLERQSAVLYSTSREEIWHKGATSGDTLELVDVSVNCEQNSLLYRVRKAGTGVCHTKDETGTARQTCYYRTVTDADSLEFG
jgi:phosphoribosyl-AMP cyclohydrolase